MDENHNKCMNVHRYTIKLPLNTCKILIFIILIKLPLNTYKRLIHNILLLLVPSNISLPSYISFPGLSYIKKYWEYEYDYEMQW
jgi:hypothetical protein